MSTSGSGVRYVPPPKTQTLSFTSQDNPISGTKYEWNVGNDTGVSLGTQSNARLLGLIARVTWTVQPTPLEVHITLGGILHTFVVANPVSGTNYGLNGFAPADGVLAQSLGTGLGTSYAVRDFWLEDKTVKVEVETTGGTVQNLSLWVMWQKW